MRLRVRKEGLMLNRNVLEFKEGSQLEFESRRNETFGLLFVSTQLDRETLAAGHHGDSKTFRKK